jgi:hypothetical protein
LVFAIATEVVFDSATMVKGMVTSKLELLPILLKNYLKKVSGYDNNMIWFSFWLVLKKKFL